jgi:vacuolar-type H+-ATPase subunit E/Vma4
VTILANNSNDSLDTGIAPLIRHMQEQRKAQCEALRSATDDEVQKITAALDLEKAAFSKSAGAEQVELRKEANNSVVLPAKRKSDMALSRETGVAIEDMLDLCTKKLKSIAASSEFTPVLEAFIREVVACAQDLFVDAPVEGTLHVSPADVSACQALCKKNGWGFDVQADDTVWGGLVFHSSNERHLIRNTFSSRMEKQEQELRALALDRINQALTKSGSSR